MVKAQTKSLILGIGAGTLAVNQLMNLLGKSMAFLQTAYFGISLLDVAAIATAIGLFWLYNKETR
jgi:hypothetical protein